MADFELSDLKNLNEQELQTRNLGSGLAIKHLYDRYQYECLNGIKKGSPLY